MHSIRLDIQDSVFDKVISFLNALPKNKIVIKNDDSHTYSDFNSQNSDTILYSNHTANLIDEWKDDKEDEIWK